jgi:hypothetical protein
MKLAWQQVLLTWSKNGTRARCSRRRYLVISRMALSSADLARRTGATRHRPQLMPGHGLNLVMTAGQNAAGPQHTIRAFPEVTWDVLTARLDVGDRAAAVLGLFGKGGLGIPGCATVGGEFFAKLATRTCQRLRFPHRPSPVNRQQIVSTLSQMPTAATW